MNTHRHSVRAALVVVGSIAVAAVSNGCSTSERTGQSAQDITECTDCFRFTPNEISTETATASSEYVLGSNSAASCPSFTIPIPASLAGFNCTLGVAITGDVNLPSTTFPSVNGAPGVQAYAWACESFQPSASAVTTTLNYGGFSDFSFQTPLDATVSAAIQKGTFGGPDVGGVTVGAVTPAATTDTCYGAANPGWEVVLEVAFTSSSYECVYHPGVEMPIPHGIAVSSLYAVHQFWVACPIALGGCECPSGGTAVLSQ